MEDFQRCERMPRAELMVAYSGERKDAECQGNTWKLSRIVEKMGIKEKNSIEEEFRSEEFRQNFIIPK